MKVIFNHSSLADDIEVEVCERKGLGHPDTLSDGLAEACSNAYSRYCREKFGAVLHHNLDKMGIRGGLFDIDYGRADFKAPPIVLVGGRISSSFGGEEIPVREIIEETTQKYLSKILPRFAPYVNQTKFVHLTSSFSKIPFWYQPRSLDDVPDAKKPFASDTAAVCAWAPFSRLERLTLYAESFFYNLDGSARFEDVGHDIKVMGIRHGESVDLTVALPIHSDTVKSFDDYNQRRLGYQAQLGIYLQERETTLRINCVVNSQSDQKDKQSKYITATGSCIDFGEEGYVGRGNPHNGVISSMRPVSVEAAFGKNPSYHTGKVLSFFARKISTKLFERLEMHNEIIAISNNGSDLRRPTSLAIRSKRQAEGFENVIDELISEVTSVQDYVAEIIDGYFMPRLVFADK